MILNPPNIRQDGLPAITRQERIAMKLIKANGYTLNPEKIACIERGTMNHFNDATKQMQAYDGITITFDAGGHKRIEGLAADMIESAYYDWYTDQPLPY
jgi:hypothetical protein